MEEASWLYDNDALRAERRVMDVNKICHKGEFYLSEPDIDKVGKCLCGSKLFSMIEGYVFCAYCRELVAFTSYRSGWWE